MEPFEYTDDPQSWVPYPRCPADLTEFNQRLADRFGRNRFDGPVFQCVWGGGEREIKPDGRWGLKYFRVFAKPKVRMHEQSGLLVTKMEREELGNPRFIIERFQSPEKMGLAERLTHPRGRYVFYYEVEDERGKYRVPAQDTIEHIAECLAGEDEAERQLNLELARMAKEEEDDLERNAAGLNLPYNPGLPAVASPRR